MKTRSYFSTPKFFKKKLVTRHLMQMSTFTNNLVDIK